MRNHHFIAGSMLLALVIAVAISGTAAAQNPDNTPSASSPSSPAQTAPSTSAPAASPQDQDSAPAARPAPGQGGASAPAQTAEDNPLGLTEDQKARLRPIVTEETQQMEAVRGDTSLTQEQKIQKINQIRETASPKIKAILTPEQLQKLAEMQRARQQQDEPGGSQAPPQK